TTTYADPAVQAEIEKHYLAVSVDADSDPALTSRYGDWGWPATIVLKADGTEIVKRRGYIPPAQMLSLLNAIVADPTPGPSIGAALQIADTGATSLGQKQRAALLGSFDNLYDETNAGWGSGHKYVDASSIEWSFAALDAGNQAAIRKIRHTLDANLNLIDPVWGGVYQYSDHIDWKSPHFEKLMSFQADDLRVYSDAYARWHRPSDLGAAQKIYGYMTKFLSAPDGGFYVSQDADVSPKVTGHDFYSKDDAARRAIGMPRIDTHEYSRETGWAIRALCKYYDVTAEAQALERAKQAARWALSARGFPGGGFGHAAAKPEAGGPFLDDNVSMTQAFVALYRSTGDREWLHDALATLDFMDAKLRDLRAGYVAAPPPSGGRGVFREPIRDSAQNAELVSAASMLHHYTGAERPLQVAQHAMKYLSALAAADSDRLRPEILLADHELSVPPIHITVEGNKDDPAARALHAAALRYPSDYLQVDWWDRREGKLPDPAITYPVLPRAAAFACTANACSTPVFDPAELEGRVHAVLN
ncbi:MAG TPA: hypothetical protein VFB37_17605, partial [Steroidobacteraceae bacterium]|nr:hypothetical protein [Steroidobacteraceae bacterium]